MSGDNLQNIAEEIHDIVGGDANENIRAFVQMLQPQTIPLGQIVTPEILQTWSRRLVLRRYIPKD